MLWHVVSAAVDLQWGKKSCKNYQSTNIPTKFTFNWTSGFGKDDDNVKSLQMMLRTDTKWWQYFTWLCVRRAKNE